ncbi:[LysW]-aminoadipate/[LysW]-glutamate kinase [Candidatus Gugararchaeum adminiculabundum]|nr:[LysW]-aminoadipate/[LysW]-glutamate kinase [Candidatus Gugararchaeum adminiculabundum]
MEDLIKKADVIIEALPYIQKYENKVIVVKYGGNIPADKLESVARDIAALKGMGLRPLVVHGAGPQISEEMRKAKLEPKFVNGLRVTDKETVKIVEKVFAEMSSDIITLIKKYGEKGKAVSGSNDGVILARMKDPALGFVGEIRKINPLYLKKLLRYDYVPVVSPLGIDTKGRIYNINADTAAAAIAGALKAEKLTVITNVDGVMENGKLHPTLTIRQANKKIKSGVISGGMIPKVEACIHAVKAGIPKAHLINGSVDHALLIELFTQKGIGTEFVKKIERK